MRTLSTSELNAGDVVEVCLDPVIGQEKNKRRPCLIIQSGGSHLQLVIILPITDATGKTNRRLYVDIANLKTAGLKKPSVVDCFQIRAVSVERILNQLGQIEDSVLEDVRTRLAAVLDIGEEHVT